MTPVQKLKHLILIKAAELADHELNLVTTENVEALYLALGSEGGHWGAQAELREGEVATNIPCDWSRHYESRSVAARYIDGSWVGWTYWFGGGKHGEPEAIEWIDEAYALDVTEREEMMVVRTFAKAQSSDATSGAAA